MNSRDNQAEQSAELLKRPEKQASRIPENPETISSEETRQMLHELGIHQIRLEMQNEELREANARLESTLERYGELYDLAPIGYCTISEQGLILETNLAAAALLGMDRNTLVKQPIIRYIKKKDQDIYSRHSKQLFETGEPQAYELQMMKKDGTTFWGHLTVTLAKMNYGNAVCRVVLSNITDRKHAEEALMQSELELREVLNATADGILAVDSHGKVIKMNHRFVELWRIPQALADSKDEQGMLNFVLYQLSDPEAFIKKVQALYDSINYDMDTLNFKDGRVFERYSAPLMLDSALFGRVWSFRDVTERKRVESALQKSEALLKDTQRISKTGGWEYDVTTHIATFTSGVFDIYGTTFSEAEEGVKFYHPDDRALVWQSFENAIVNNEPYDLEVRLINAQGENLWVRTIGKPLLEGGKVVKIVGNLMDITDCKRAEEALGALASQWQNTFDAVNDGVCLLDRDQHIVRCNKAMSDLFSKNSNDMIGKACWEVIHGTNEPIPGCPLKKMRKTLRRESMELKIADRWFEVTVDPFFGADKKLAGIVHIIRDITERKQSEEKITMLAQAVETTAECIGITDKDYNLVFVNRAFLPAYGYTKDELIGRHISIIHSENNDTKVSNNLFSTLAKQQTWKGEVLNKRKDGSDFPVLLTVTPLLNEKRELVGSVGITKDITEQKQKEAEIRIAKEHLEMLTSSSTVIIYTCKAFGDFDATFISENIHLIMGYTIEEFLSKGFWVNHIHPEDAPKVLENIPKIFESDFHKHEYRFLFNDGTYHWMNDELKLLRDENGNPSEILGTWSDITERKQAEEKIMFRNILLSIQQEASLDGILVVDKNNNIIWNNRRFVEIMNIPQELIEHKNDEPVLRFVTEQMANPQQFLQRVHYLYEHLTETSRDELVLKDGRIFDRYSAPMYGFNDQYYGRCWYFRDITDRKLVEKEIQRKNEDLLKLNTEKDKFFSIIAHDLRSPFQGFLGLTQEMAEELPRLTKDEMQKIAAGMRDSAANLFRLLENLLEWARIQQGVIPFNPEVVKLHKIIDEGITAVQATAQSKGIEIVCDIPDDIKVFADSNMLQSVIRNIISNAVKFTHKGGRVSVSAKNTKDKSVEISIRDSGIGMSKAIVDNLFRLDVRTNRKGTNGEPSTGLGLLLCKEFIEKHGGRIRVESEEGKGSVFHFTIPFSTVPGKENVIKNINPAVEKDVQIKPLKILIAEDDEKSEILIALEVKNFGKEILKARTGFEAVEACSNNPDIDLVLMDIEMTEMDGYEAARQIRQFNKDVVIIAQTAYALTGERKKALAAGCNDYIAKPFTKTSLTTLLKKYF